MNNAISATISNELNVRTEQVNASIQLLDAGNTVPFIARYRKEVTGGLDDSQLRHLEERLSYLRELAERRNTILRSIEEQGKLTAELATAIENTNSKTELEDLYLPYKPKRRTRGQIAREAGLEPLADSLWNDPKLDPQTFASQYIQPQKGIDDSKMALEGARYILMERFAEDATLLAKIRRYLWKQAHLVSRVVEGKEAEGAKFRDYFQHHEAIHKIPSHRVLAMLRGRNAGILHLSLNPEPQYDPPPAESMGEQMIMDHLQIRLDNAAADAWRRSVIRSTWRVKILLHLETELLSTLREQAEEEAINVFARNLKAILMGAPAGMHTTMGLDPGLRTGVKVAIVDATGKLLTTDTLFPHTGGATKAAAKLAELCVQYNVELVAIGNGTASRETERFYAEVKRQFPHVTAASIVVSEAGASVYSASALAAEEFPDLDVSLRGAVSIARRLQDPLAELVKIDPKSIGVGQYQHDVAQSLLAKKLNAVVEDCVNAVGVDLNTASVPLLRRVAGLSPTLAQNIVRWREKQGRFTERQQLLQVERLGAKAFEQAAGFLRITQGLNPLDSSSVHPESYPLVERILAATQQTLATLMGNTALLRSLDPEHFTDPHFGSPTVSDILKELEKPGRDPRPEFKTAQFIDGIETLSDLHVGMILEGVITNVTNFGAFADIGVHQDGLIHISALADQYIDDPHKVVKTGDIVKVKVMEIDMARKRIALSRRLHEPTVSQASSNKHPPAVTNTVKQAKPLPMNNNSALGDALNAALRKKRP